MPLTVGSRKIEHGKDLQGKYSFSFGGSCQATMRLRHVHRGFCPLGIRIDEENIFTREE